MNDIEPKFRLEDEAPAKSDLDSELAKEDTEQSIHIRNFIHSLCSKKSMNIMLCELLINYNNELARIYFGYLVYIVV